MKGALKTSEGLSYGATYKIKKIHLEKEKIPPDDDDIFKREKEEYENDEKKLESLLDKEEDLEVLIESMNEFISSFNVRYGTKILKGNILTQAKAKIDSFVDKVVTFNSQRQQK